MIIRTAYIFLNIRSCYYNPISSPKAIQPALGDSPGLVFRLKQGGRKREKDGEKRRQEKQKRKTGNKEHDSLKSKGKQSNISG